MFNWEIKKIYCDMIDKHQRDLRGKTTYGITITEEFLMILRKRLYELNAHRKDWFYYEQN